MQIFHQLEDFKDHKKPVILTIGNFDGVHLGHLAVLQRARTFARDNSQLTVLTFSNHPSEVLRPEQPVPLLCTLKHKIQLLQMHSLQALVLLPFTRYLANHSAASFIERVRQFIPFTHLILGHDATLGRDRQGNKSTMQQLALEWGFTVHYVDEYRYEGQPVSSTRIRGLIQQGELGQAETLLGRPYSIYSHVLPGLGKGKQIGFPTANLEVRGLCLPPFGVYAVEVRKDNQSFRGIANLGLAPTVREDRTPLLEVHLLSSHPDFYEEPIEVIFEGFIRPEKKFESLEDLRRQIKQDIEQVKNLEKPHSLLE
ncbi:bifunctional riboflavin kinase/FAD synthetase [Candidatus Protochlamydia phocaeensis]|uniref:bifunctional riboflavin kinase/FAD synthetase n=1 Tax=Candidatus Protochlamydia phocaeensis TaxID=1414722 RepID=UPI000837D4B9|nr:bifunctional riboflavin kinase/FAD synthetase [Candidatus Protochlamydia phocaeensis]